MTMGDFIPSTPETEIDTIKDFCLVDMQLMRSTTRKYVGEIKKFLRYVKENKSKEVRKTVRDYLKSVPNNGNSLRALKAYFKYIGYEEAVINFKFPKWLRKIRHVTKKDLQVFYQALRNWREKALFLFKATSGLRKMEVLSLRMDDVDFKNMIIIPKNHMGSRSKHS
jgi:integrase